MKTALLAALFAAPAVAQPAAAKPEFEAIVLEVLKDQAAPVVAPVKAVPVKTVKSVALAGAKKVCRLYGMDRDNCLYRCSDGTNYSRPIDVEPARPGDPFGSPRIACPQLVIPF